MKTVYALLVLAVLGIVNAVLLAAQQNVPPKPTNMISAPPENTFSRSLSASGLVESYGTDIEISPCVAGVIQEVYVTVGDSVEKGSPLFTIDDRTVRQHIAEGTAMIRVLKAQEKKLLSQLHRLYAVRDDTPTAVSLEEIQDKEDDLAIVRGQLSLEEERLRSAETQLDVLTVRAPEAGYVLRNEYRKGEFASFQSVSPPSFVLGSTKRLQVRLDVDEQLIHLVKPHAKAVGYTKGAAQYPLTLTFVRIEPYVIPKRSLTGAMDERTDTRVLQCIYELQPNNALQVFPGQQIDAYIEANEDRSSPLTESTPPSSQGAHQ